MEAIKTNIKDAYIIQNQKFDDDRGFFIESFNLKKIENVIKTGEFVQDNHSKSIKGVLRGLHYQIEHPQGKLVRCLSGSVYDVIVDLRKSSYSYGKWFGIELSSPNVQVWAPAGVAHGFYTLSETADVFYKVTDYYHPEHDRTLIWNDPNIQIEWPISDNVILSEKDKLGKSFITCEKYE